MERTFLEGLNIEAGVIDSIMNEHNKTKTKLESDITTLTNTNSTLQTQVDSYVTKEKTTEFHNKLKAANVKDDRVAAFTTLLGEDQSDAAIENLKKEYPEWVVSNEQTPPPADPNTPPKQHPNFVPSGNPSFGQGGGDDKDGVQELLAAWK